MASVRVEMNHNGAKALLNDEGVLADLERRAQQIASQAGGEPDFVVETHRGGARARAAVLTATFAGMRAEATDRALSNALNAGR